MIDAFFLDGPPLTEREVLMLSPLRLAYIGDAVYDLLVRTWLIHSGAKAGAMHRDAIQKVNAAAQARALRRVAGQLTQTEEDVVRRGRNAHANHGIPRRASPADYKQATGLEALLGFLYLTGQAQRLRALLPVLLAEQEEDATCHEVK